MHRKLRPQILVLLVLAAFPKFAWCDDSTIQPDRPGIADGSSVVGSGHFQLETGFEEDLMWHTHSSQRTITTPTLIRVGLSSSLEARVESNAYSNLLVSTDGQSNHRTAGYSPISAGLKYNFSPATESNGGLSLGLIGRFFPINGSGDFRSHHSTGDVRLAADKDIGDGWGLTGNLGIAAYEDDSNREFATALIAGTITRSLTDSFAIFGDFGFQGPESHEGGGTLLVDGGATYLIGKNVQLDVSCGSGLTGVNTSDFFWSTGLSFLL